MQWFADQVRTLLPSTINSIPYQRCRMGKLPHQTYFHSYLSNWLASSYCQLMKARKLEAIISKSNQEPNSTNLAFASRPGLQNPIAKVQVAKGPCPSFACRNRKRELLVSLFPGLLTPRAGAWHSCSYDILLRRRTRSYKAHTPKILQKRLEGLSRHTIACIA